MFEEKISPEDLAHLKHHYERNSEPEDMSLEGFIKIIAENFHPHSIDRHRTFKDYIDKETHHSMTRANFSGNHEEWGERYGLTPEGYNAIRSANIEKFVMKVLELTRKGRDAYEKRDFQFELRK